MTSNRINVPWNQVAQIVATHCCVCRAELTDPVSIQSAIGPVCSRKFYRDELIPTAEQVDAAVGLLAAADVDEKLPAHIIDACLGFVKEDKANGRKISSLLLYFASAHYAEREIVFRCAGVIRALGYTELADKLEIDRVRAIVRETDEAYECYLPHKHDFMKGLRVIPGLEPLMITEEIEDNRPIKDPNDVPATQQVQGKVGSKFGWKIPKVHLPHLECLLGVHFEGELISYGNGRIKTIPYRPRHALRAFTNPAALIGSRQVPPVPVASADVKMVPDGKGNVRLTSPKNYQFVAEMKAQIPYRDRRFEWNGTYWEINARHVAVLTALVQKFYNVTL